MLLSVDNHKAFEIPMWLDLGAQPSNRYHASVPHDVSVRTLTRAEFNLCDLSQRHRALFLEGFTRGMADEIAWRDTMSSMSFIILLERDGDLIGAGQANIVGPIALVHNIVVARKARDNGYGRFLIKSVLHRSREHARWAALHTDPEGGETDMYTDLGFFNIEEAHRAWCVAQEETLRTVAIV